MLSRFIVLNKFPLDKLKIYLCKIKIQNINKNQLSEEMLVFVFLTVTSLVREP